MKARKIISIVLAAALSLGALAGCGRGGDDAEKSGGENTGGAKGRYLETDVALPEKTSVYGMVKLEDGTIRIATNDQEGREAVWDLAKDTGSWEKVYDMPEEWRQTDTFFVTHVALSPKGDAFAVTSQVMDQSAQADENNSEATQTKECFYHLDGKGNVTEVPMGVKEYAYFMQYAKDGELVAQFQNTPVSSINMETGELTDKVSGAERIAFFGMAGSTLYAVDYDEGISVFDMQTGDPLPKDEGLSDSIAQSGTQLNIQSLQTMPIIFTEGKEEQEIFYCTNKGLYRHVKDGNVTELLIDGSLTSLGSPDTGLISMEAMDNGEFYVLAIDSQSNKLLHYAYSKDTATVPEAELKAWTLYENSEFVQNISQYQKENPETFINLEVGVTEENGVTASDALKNLSTEIMAGNGPDILMLDGLPVDSYVEKGLLEDLSDVAGRAEDLFPNLISAMERDGKLYGIPLRFAIPLIEADAQTLEKIQDLKSLADAAEELKKANPDRDVILPYYDGALLAAQLYDVCAPVWVKEDGTIEKERLEEFYAQLSRIFDPEKYVEMEIHAVNEGYRGYVSSLGGGNLYVYSDKMLLNFGNLWSDSDFSQLATTLAEKPEISYKPLTGQTEHVFVPKTIAGVSAKSKSKEEAKNFVQFLLTKDAQTANQGGGLPVNQKALEDQIDRIDAGMTIGSGMANDPDSYVEMTIQKPSEEAVKRFIGYIQEADTPTLNNEIIRNAVLSQAVDCVNGKITPKAAVQAVADQVNLYLAE
ncbi:MAG: carbohydrate ABC transporter substrate-binding protein [Lachnospiraceae bacterium]|nr:carbohydrate ABC transporter substrate-binding protein [Lachnospiraceae bacterium]